MEDKIKQDAIKEAEEHWENGLKQKFKEQLTNCMIEPLSELNNQIKNFEKSMTNHILSLNEKFEKKYNKQMIQIQQQSNIQINNIINNNPIENKNELMKAHIDFSTYTNPPLKNLILPNDSNILINLILYCFINIRTFISYYLNPAKKEKIMWKSKDNPNKLGTAFLNLLDHYWKSKLDEYSPLDIHQILNNLMKNNYNTQNPGLIFECILSQLNSELSPNQVNENINKENDPYLIFSREKVFEGFKKRYKTPTKISNCFYNIIETEFKCESCDTTSYSIENLPIINIYLQANKDKRYNNLSFREHFKTLLIDKNEEKINEDCLICGSKKSKFINKHILDTTELIIININRNNDPNNLVEFKYPEVIDKKDIINATKAPVFNEMKYEIFCVIKKYKIYNNSQFLMFCKNFINDTWYSYNIKNIRKVDIKEVFMDSKKTCLIIYKNKV